MNWLIEDPHAGFWAMRIELEALYELNWPDWAIDVWFAVHD